MTDCAGRILVGDDAHEMCAAIVEVFRKQNYHCVAAHAGPEVEKNLGEREWDLLICDVQMPGNMRLELVREVRSRWPALPIILITGHPTLDIALQALNLKLSAMLEKPFKMPELVTLAVQAIKTHRLARMFKNSVELKAVLNRSIHRKLLEDIFVQVKRQEEVCRRRVDQARQGFVKAGDPTRAVIVELTEAVASQLSGSLEILGRLGELAAAQDPSKRWPASPEFQQAVAASLESLWRLNPPEPVGFPLAQVGLEPGSGAAGRALPG